MAYENVAGLSVHNHYGPRETGLGVAGHRTTKEGERELVVEITPTVLASGAFLQPVTIPAKSVVTSVVLKIVQAFGIKSSAFIVYGRDINNGAKLLEANLEATAGTLSDLTSTAPLGEFSTGIATAMPMAFYLSATDAVANTAIGKAELVITYTVIG